MPHEPLLALCSVKVVNVHRMGRNALESSARPAPHSAASFNRPPVLHGAAPRLPCRLQAGEWYALPQSPQLFKQMLMVSGFDRYYQARQALRSDGRRGLWSGQGTGRAPRIRGWNGRKVGGQVVLCVCSSSWQVLPASWPLQTARCDPTQMPLLHASSLGLSALHHAHADCALLP